METATAPDGETQVDLLILEGQGESTLAFVPVFIRGEGPFAFALDTGASNTVIDERLARRLNLPVSEEQNKASGVFSRQTVSSTEVDEWQIGSVQLSSTEAIAFELSDDAHGMQGLLGSDVLSRFGRVTIDYDRERLYLREK